MPSQDEYLDNLLKGLLPEELGDSDTAENTAIEEPDTIENEDTVTEPAVIDSADAATEPAAINSADVITEQDTVNSADIMESASVMGESDIVENLTAGADSEKRTEQALDMSDMDELLKAALEVDEEKPSEDTDSRTEMTDLNSMTEEDINRLLDEASRPEQEAAEEASQEDLQDLLTAMNDEGSSEIRNLLDKADHNEPVDPSIEELLKGEGMEEEINPLEDAAGIETEQKEDRAARRKRKREERKAAKEAKKKEKAAKKKRKSAGEGTEDSAENEGPLAQDSTLFGESGDSLPESSELFKGAEEPLPEGIGLQEEGIASLTDSEDLQEEMEALAQENTPKKKKSIFARFMEFITEEDEEDEDNESGDGSELKLSEENTAILKEMNQEEEETGKAKKGKKEKPKKEKPKKEKKAKEPKPRKEKKPRKEPVEKEAEPPAKKLPKKKVIVTSLLAASIGGVILICTSLFTEFQVKREGVTAFYEGDYQRCYQNLYGKNLNEQEQMFYAKSESILRIRVWLREYEILAGEGLEAEALDSLIQSVDDYPELYEYALQCNAVAEVETAYAQIIDILYDKYQLTEEQAKEIADIQLDWDYTKAVLDIVAGGGYGAGEPPQEPVTGGEEGGMQDLPDPLPEESDLAQIPFVDNNR